MDKTAAEESATGKQGDNSGDDNQYKQIKQLLEELMGEKKAVEAELDKALFDLKSMNVTMEEKLVDEDDFPRADIDVHKARLLRSTIRRLKNDHSVLMKRLDENLRKLHGINKEKAKP